MLAFGHWQQTVDVWLEGLEFPLPLDLDKSFTLRVGGSLERDDIYVSGYSEHSFDLEVQSPPKEAKIAEKAKSDSQERITLRRFESADGNLANATARREVVSIGGRVAGLVALRDGATISVPGSDGKTQELIFSQPNWKLGAEGPVCVPNASIVFTCSVNRSARS